MTSPHEVVCSSCGVANHNLKECPVMHQYIEKQGDGLAQRRMEEYNQLQEWVGHNFPLQVPARQEIASREEDPMKESQLQIGSPGDRKLQNRKFRRREE